MKKLLNLSLEERLQWLDVLSNEQVARIYGGVGNDNPVNTTLSPTVAPTITLPPVTVPRTLPFTLSIGKGGGSISFPINI